eukprot:XP_011677913.1 PREDICTED: uncharacterized protein LOC105444847 [Strongylocentrotus purpuratus]
MATVKERAAAAVIGCLCADAAAQPIHWIYNLGKLEAILSALEYPEFRFPSANPYYRIDTGKNTCYGDQTRAVLVSLVRSKGLDSKDFDEQPSTITLDARSMEKQSQRSIVQKLVCRRTSPIHGAWKTKIMKDFLVKILEYFILNGSDGNVLDDVVKQLKDPDRTYPHSLDRAVVGFLEQVKRKLSVPHLQAATKVFKNN